MSGIKYEEDISMPSKLWQIQFLKKTKSWVVLKFGAQF